MARHFLISFGVWIIAIPFFGIPEVWKNGLIIVSGLFLILVSLGPSVLEKLEEKPKLKKRKNAVVKNTETNIEKDQNYENK